MDEGKWIYRRREISIIIECYLIQSEMVEYFYVLLVFIGCTLGY